MDRLVPSLPWIDWALLAVLAVSVGIGMARGFIFECLSLAGWVVAWLAAQWLAPRVAVHLPVGTPGSPINLAAAFALGFIGALVVWSLLAKLVRMLIHATPLSAPDRLLGGGFGALRGGVLLLGLAMVVALTPAAQSLAWRSSQGAQWLGRALHMLKPVLPGPVARHLPA